MLVPAKPEHAWLWLPHALAACPALPCLLSCQREEPAQASRTGVLDWGDSAETHRNHLRPSACLCEAEISAQVPPLSRASGAHAQRSCSDTTATFFGWFGPWQRSVSCRPPGSHPLGGPPCSIRAVDGVEACRWLGGTRRLQCGGMLHFWLEHVFGTEEVAVGFAVGFAGRLAGLAVRLAGGFGGCQRQAQGCHGQHPCSKLHPLSCLLWAEGMEFRVDGHWGPCGGMAGT